MTLGPIWAFLNGNMTVIHKLKRMEMPALKYFDPSKNIGGTITVDSLTDSGFEEL